MAERRKRGTERELDEVPRPPCAGCGEPATSEVRLSVCRLELERDAGVRSRSYWRGTFTGGTQVQALMCDACVRANVRVDLTVAASVAGGVAR
jgi:hypothetical protein